MPTKPKRVKKKAKSKSLDDLSVSDIDNVSSNKILRRMASSSLSTASSMKKAENGDQWRTGSATTAGSSTRASSAKSCNSSPWLSKRRFYVEALLDPEDKDFGRFLSGEVSESVFDHLTLEEVKDLKLVFDAFDTDCSGSIDVGELGRVMKALGFKVTEMSVKKMLAALDVDESGEIEFNEFLDFIISKQGEDRDIHSEIMKGFKLIDSDNTGKISLDNLRSVCRQNGVQLNDQELRDMIQEADQDGDSEISPSEFIEIMLKTNLF